MDEVEPIALFADFDSANMARYERVSTKVGHNQFMASSSNNFFNPMLDDRPVGGLYCKLYETEETYSMQIFLTLFQDMEQSRQVDVPNVDVEFNVWTKPDCHSTPFANGNR